MTIKPHANKHFCEYPFFFDSSIYFEFYFCSKSIIWVNIHNCLCKVNLRCFASFTADLFIWITDTVNVILQWNSNHTYRYCFKCTFYQMLWADSKNKANLVKSTIVHTLVAPIIVWSLIRGCWVDFCGKLDRRVDTIIRATRVGSKKVFRTDSLNIRRKTTGEL